MILALVAVLVLVAVAILVSYLNLKVARAHEVAAQDLLVTSDQIIDAIVGLRGFQASLDEQGEQLLAVRKQMKAVLRDASRTNADAKRLLQRQYAQQADVNDILYWAKERRGELNNG
jgi:hypothetical protein